MAGRKRDVTVDFIVDDKQKSKLRGIGDEAKATGGRFQALSGGVKAAALGVGALVGTKIISFLGDAAQAALDDQKAQVQLAVALENTVGATKAQIAAAEDWIDTTARATGITDDELRPSLALLVRATGDVEKAQGLMGTAMDIATARGLPLEAVTLALTKAAQGNVGAMGRMGLKVRDASGAFLSFDEALAEANRSMGGATTAAAESAEGAIRRMNVTVDEAKESIGGLLLPILAQGAESINDLSVAIGFFGDELAKIPGPTGEVVDTVKGLLGPFGLLNKATGFLAGEIEKVTAANEALVAPLKVSEGRYDMMTEAVGANTEALQDNAAELRAQIDPMFNLIDKIEALDEAQRNSGAARVTYGEGSAEHRETLRKEALAWLSVKDAQVKVAEESGITSATFRQNLEEMQIFTREEIDLMIEDFERVERFKFSDKTIRVNTRGDIINNRSMPHFDRGGVVAGPVGQPQLAVVHGGEEVLTRAERHQRGGSAPVYNVTINAGVGANGAQIGRVFVEAVKQYERQNGKSWRS